ncbi:CHAT domain-containing protein [Streptomyces sp. NPDC006335]|uniref:CHAT domain-containing protein n=1 Tax=Streptomyces sp. NPDC006335 TaxID=3156895 RepID=UPI0033ACAA0E
MSGFEEALRAGRLEDALRLAEAAVAGGGPEAPAALRDLARARIRTGRFPSAVAAAEEGLRRDTGAHEAELRMILADAYERLGEFNRAEALCLQVSASIVGLSSLARFRTLVHRNVATARLAERRGELLRAEYLLNATLSAGRQATVPTASPSPDALVAQEFFGGVEHLVHLHRGRVARKLGERSLAEAELGEALARARSLGDAEAMMLSHVEFARLGESPAVALNHLLEALWWHESPQTEFRDDELRAAVRADQEELFQDAIDQAFDVGSVGMAWRLSERARARVFLSRMGVRPDPPVAPPGSRARASRAVTDAVYKRSYLGGARRNARVLAALEEKEQIVLGPASELAAPGRRDDRTGVLQYFVSRTRLYCTLEAGGSLKMACLPVGAAVLRRKVVQLRDRLETLGSAVDLLSRQLHHWLIEPFDAELDGLDHLVIVPYGVLSHLPFAMLGRERPLLERVGISYAPSTAILNRLLDAPAAALGTSMIIGDPHPDDDELALPYGEREAQRIAALLGADLAVGPAATTTAFRDSLATHDVVHLACHAWFDPQRPRESALVLADPGDPRRPGRVTVAELTGQRARARLITLSGCQTGLADLAPGGELDGLVRAFMTAGVPSVIASLWTVDDRSTSDLMTSLYTALSDGLPLAAALRAATLAARTATPHPHHWAPFCQYGDWTTTFVASRTPMNEVTPTMD